MEDGGEQLEEFGLWATNGMGKVQQVFGDFCIVNNRLAAIREFHDLLPGL
jgi:hypothetical protein